MTIKSIQIELDRPDGRYYAGEVVKGTVRLVTTDANYECRGFHLRFMGKSHIHWHTGSGDNRHDYYGTTVFQDQRVTLFGTFYKSGLLDNAGADAFFDKIQNAGSILIPTNHAQSMDLNVRVMDYDWGKRDDLLGEIRLNVGTLVRSATEQSFPLTRFGKPEKGEITLSAKILPFGALFPQRSSSGTGISSVASKTDCIVLHIHKATGLRKADWVGKNDVYVQVYEATDPFIVGKALPKPNKKVCLPAGESLFPFAFQLRNDAPGSAELREGDQSWVRYFIRASVDLAHWRDPSYKRVITVIPNRPLPMPTLLAPFQTQTMDAAIHNCAYCGCKCCRADGLVSITLATDRLAYAPGEKIDLAGSKVVNESTKDMTASIILRRFVIMRTASNVSTHRLTNYCLAQVPIPPSSTTDMSTQSCTIPSVFPSFYGGIQGTPTPQFYPCLRWTYAIDLQVGFQGVCTGEAHAISPLLISAAPPYAGAIQTLTALATIQTPWDIFNYAVVGPEACHTCPTITGPEDGGIATNAEQLGPIWTNDHEDAGVVGETPLYQPVVQTFSSPIADGNILKPSSSSIPTYTGDEVSINIDQLLQEMDTSFDKRLVVGTWLRNHSTEKRYLTPNDFGRILSKVTFSLDQPAVVGELVASLEGTDCLTCAHTIAAMKVCPYQKTEVAKLMAPHVRDPEHKNMVLQQIDFEYEKKMIVFR